MRDNNFPQNGFRDARRKNNNSGEDMMTLPKFAASVSFISVLSLTMPAEAQKSNDTLRTARVDQYTRSFVITIRAITPCSLFMTV